MLINGDPQAGNSARVYYIDTNPSISWIRFNDLCRTLTGNTDIESRWRKLGEVMGEISQKTIQCLGEAANNYQSLKVFSFELPMKDSPFRT
jgi:hypothetical protein